jgi:hypothetical protein
LAGEHNALVCVHSFRYNYVIALALPQFHGAEVSCIVGFHHVDERPFLTNLCGLIGDQHSRLFRIQNEFYVYELPGPEVTVGIADCGAQINGATAVLH